MARVRLSNPRVFAKQVESAVLRSPQLEASIEAHAKKYILPQIEQIADKHYRGAVKTLSNTLREGISNSSGSTARGMNKLTVTSAATGEQITIPVRFAALHPKYRSFKRNHFPQSENKFWRLSGDLAANVAAVAPRKSKAKISFTRGTRRSSIPFDVIVTLKRLPPPLDDLIRRSMIAGEAQAAGTGRLKFAKIDYLEGVGEGSKSRSRPFIGRLSAQLGRAMLKDLKNFN